MKLDLKNVKKIVDSRFHDFMKEDEYEFNEVDAVSLLNHKRADIYIKVKLVKAILDVSINRNELDYYKFLYEESLNVFTKGTFVEPGDSNKNSFDDYYKQLVELIKSIQNDKEPNIYIPVDKYNTPIDGAHRLAICAVLNIKVKSIKLEGITVDYGLEYFKKNGADKNFINRVLSLMLSLNDSIRISVLWPSATVNINKVKELYGNGYIYDYSLNLNQIGINNLSALCYKNEPWVGGVDNLWKGAKLKGKNCYKKDKCTRIIIFSSQGLNDSNKIKEKIREECNGSKHNIHSTDTLKEANEIIHSTFNNDADLKLNTLNLNKLGECLLGATSYDLIEDVIFTGSIILELYSLRISRDVDIFIRDIKHFDNINFDSSWGTHNQYINNYSFESIEQVFIDPVLVDSYMGVKFLSLDELIIFKNNRNENKDINDICLIKNLKKRTLSSSDLEFMLYNYKFKFNRLKNIIKRKVKKAIKWKQ
ncbi:hypothetical protein [Aliivibrio fischeri]|uniref:hypothetical protein n=1 Tax=Aliivibrio fischeri TaxID=668 RepID=UPI0007C5CD85|nr:hypothetical protein [Aliivibrio fischeri]